MKGDDPNDGKNTETPKGADVTNLNVSRKGGSHSLLLPQPIKENKNDVHQTNVQSDGGEKANQRPRDKFL